MRDLLDDDGENRAVRCFLMQYGVPGLTVGAMKKHMSLSGWPFWPDWVKEQDGQHLTKGGAQHWLRHLFALEAPAGAGVALPPSGEPFRSLLRDALEYFSGDSEFIQTCRAALASGVALRHSTKETGDA